MVEIKHLLKSQQNLNHINNFFMQKNIFYTIFTIFFCIIASCSKVAILDPFLISHLPHVHLLEKQDHQFCASLKINFDNRNDLNSDLYWRCRLSLAKNRLSNDNSSPRAVQHNLEISDLVAKISLKLADTPGSILTRENKKMDERHHKTCIATGYEIATRDQAKIDDYFACRRALIEEQQLFPPFGNLDYLKYRNYSYDIGFVIDNRVDQDIKEYKKAKKEYPTCTKFNLHDINFQSCTKAQDASRICFTKIAQQKFRKEWQEKIICQKKAYIRFPDAFLKEDAEKKAKLESIKKRSQGYSNRLESLGLNSDQFTAEIDVKKEEDDIKKLDLNNKNALYDKFELTRLRREYIFNCQKQSDKKIEEYLQNLEKNCQNLQKFAIIGDY